MPYRNPVEALTDTAKGQVHLYWAAYAIVQAQAQAGNVKIIAIANSEPTTLLARCIDRRAGKVILT